MEHCTQFILGKIYLSQQECGVQREVGQEWVDVTGPPSLPRHFVVKKGCMEDVDVGSDSEEDEDENSELNTGMLLDIDSDNVEDHGDN